MSKVVVCIIARTVSTRLPLKVLRDLIPGLSMLEFMIKNIQTNAKVDEIYLCTSTAPQDDILEDVAVRNSIKFYRGSAEDVTERLSAVAQKEHADILVRVTGDNPFSAAEYIANQVAWLQEEKLDYVRMDQLPLGASCEVFTVSALERCMAEMDRSVSEYLMLFLFQPQKFRCGVMCIGEFDYGSYSLTVDTPADLERTKAILKHLSFEGDFQMLTLRKVLEMITAHPMLPALKYEVGGEVKLPYGKIVSFDEFKEDMQNRINSSFQKTVDE